MGQGQVLQGGNGLLPVIHLGAESGTKMNEQQFVYVGSFELRWKYFNWVYKIKTDSCLVLVNYNAKYDSILEECIMFDEKNNEALTITKRITIVNFEKQVVTKYSEFIVNNIKLLRTST